MNARVRFWGWLSGVALTRCARAATKAGDTHEASHCIAALRAGDSDHEHDDCRLLTVRTPHIWSWAHGDFHAHSMRGRRVVDDAPEPSEVLAIERIHEWVYGSEYRSVVIEKAGMDVRVEFVGDGGGEDTDAILANAVLGAELIEKAPDA